VSCASVILCVCLHVCENETVPYVSRDEDLKNEVSVALCVALSVALRDALCCTVCESQETKISKMKGVLRCVLQ